MHNYNYGYMYCMYIATYECFAWICNCTYMAKYEIPCGSFAGNNKRNDVDEKQNSSQSNELVQIRAGQTDQPVRIIVHVHKQSQPIMPVRVHTLVRNG